MEISVDTDAESDKPRTLLKSTLNFPVVGIGASAGGLAALQGFFDNTPAKNGMAYVIVMHLSPSHKSHAAEILQRHTKMPVTQVLGPVKIFPDHVYVISPSKDLVITDGILNLEEPTRERGPHVAIDLFFRALAVVHESRAVAIVMSGTGSDGATGLKRIKEEGGVTIAQSPDDSEFDEMPKAAIATGLVDFVLPAADIPQRLMDLWINAQNIWLPQGEQTGEKIPPPPDVDAMHRGEQALQDIMAALRVQTGHDFRHYKRATVLRRIERRLQVTGVPDLPAYREYLRTHADESAALLQDMLISVTNFFRDHEVFHAVEREVIPTLMEQRSEDDPFRAWVAGCATGEEAYSLSIMLREHAEDSHFSPPVQIFATDIDERALTAARNGIYPASIHADVSPGRIAQYFQKEGDELRVTKAVREPVLFAVHNVLRDPPFSRLDLIFCRNLLIYLGREGQTSILEVFRFALKPGGYLVLGSSETADAVTSLFTVVDKKNRIYRANPHAHAFRHLPLPAAPVNDRRFPVIATRAPAERSAVADLHLRALELFAAPSVLIDAKHNIIHLSQGAGKFLEQSGGVPSVDLVSNVHSSLRIELRNALFQASRTNEVVETRAVAFDRDAERKFIRLAIKPIPAERDVQLTMLVVFEEVGEPGSKASEVIVDPTEIRLINRLEGEIEQLKENLRDTVDHAEVSTEDLKASNEELQAINEELRSATEELETSKEELQSINEELVTVNYELKSKVDETSKINDDLQNFIVASDVATIFIDGGMRIKRFTPHAAGIFNVIASDVERPLLDITHRLHYEELADDISVVFRQLRIVERQIASSDGKTFLARIRPYRTTDDKIAGAVLTFLDVTELREAESRMRQSEERLRHAALTTRDYIIITTDDDGLITSWNEGARRIFGYEDSEVLGQHIRIIFTLEDRARGIPEIEIRNARENGRAEDERWHLRKDGAEFYCSGVMTPLHNSSNGGFVKIGRDTTGSKQQETIREAVLRREQVLSSQARIANDLKDQFLAVMSHELKHPLNLIQVNVELLLRMPDVKEIPAVQRAGESIRGAVRSQAKIIDDLLDLSRARTGKLKVNREPVHLAEMVEATVDASREDASGKNLSLIFHCNEPSMIVSCDPVRAEQIVWNLLHNAIKFTPNGGRITVSLERDADFAHLQVSDSGRGIASEFLPRVFDMFSQGTSSGATTESGLGIGLSLVEQLTLAHGGSVSVESPGPGLGATFHVRLPLEAGNGATQGAWRTSDTLAGMRILAVDDMPDSLQPFAMVLRTEGATVDTAGSGPVALDLLRKNAYDILISDLGMPTMDGFELLAAVRSVPGHEKLISIALSGYGRAIDVERALQQGFDAHLTKPVNFDELIQILKSLKPASNQVADGK